MVLIQWQFPDRGLSNLRRFRLRAAGTLVDLIGDLGDMDAVILNR